MRMHIQIYFSQKITLDDIQIVINNQSTVAIVGEKILSIDSDLSFGIHTLKILSKTAKRFIIDKVEIDGVNLRSLIYLSWLQTTDNTRIQPCAELWEPGQTWVLPFGYPVSFWVDRALSKFPPGEFGKNLFNDYWLWFPESLELAEDMPQIIKDFFKHDFDFTVVKKTDFSFKDIPYTSIPLYIDRQKLQNAQKELVEKQDIVKSLAKIFNYSQQAINREEFGYSNDREWKVIHLHPIPNGPAQYQDELPMCWDLINSLNLDYCHVFIGIMPPKTIIYPHVDNIDNLNVPENFKGCTQIYIPLVWPDENYIKFSNVGIPPVVSDATSVINNDLFIHAVVNASLEERFVLAIRTNHEYMSKFEIKQQ